jgi:K+-sensing histidine kinase KdpD
MRSFCGLYFFLRMVVFIVGLASYRLFRRYTENIWNINEIWFPSGVVFMLTALVIALVKPYRKAYMSYVDVLLLSNLALCCFVSTSKVFTFLTIKILFTLPILTLILTVLLRKARLSTILNHLSQCHHKLREIWQFKRSISTTESNAEVIEAQLPFIQPDTIGTEEVNNYGTICTY